MDRKTLIVGIVIGVLIGFGLAGSILGFRLIRTEALRRQELAIVREDAEHARESLRDVPRSSGVDWCDAELQSLQQISWER